MILAEKETDTETHDNYEMRSNKSLNLIRRAENPRYCYVLLVIYHNYFLLKALNTLNNNNNNNLMAT